MDISERPDPEQVEIAKALGYLAIATRDRSIDAGVIAVYMPHLDRYTVAEVTAACRQLQTAEYFPKAGELVKACSAARRREQDAQQAALVARLQLEVPTWTPEEIAASEARKAEIMAKMRAQFGGRKRPA